MEREYNIDEVIDILTNKEPDAKFSSYKGTIIIFNDELMLGNYKGVLIHYVIGTLTFPIVDERIKSVLDDKEVKYIKVVNGGK